MNILRLGLIVGTALTGAYAGYRYFKDDSSDESSGLMDSFPPTAETKTSVKQPHRRNRKVGPLSRPQV